MVCGKVNYTNLSRYSNVCERTYRRHFQRGFTFEALNAGLLVESAGKEDTQVGVVDCTFLEKSGRHTYGLDWYYNGKTQRAERGLELSVVAIVNLDQNTGYTLSAQQTEAGLGTPKEATVDSAAPQGNRITFYLGHLAYCIAYFPPSLRYIVADGFYSKYRWVTGVIQLGFHAVGKLRSDANLKFLYRGAYQGRGRRERVIL